MTLSQWVYAQTGYQVPSGTTPENPFPTCPKGYGLTTLGGVYQCCPFTIQTNSEGMETGYTFNCSNYVSPIPPPNTFPQFSLYWPYEPNLPTLQNWISTNKFYSSGEYASPYNSVCNYLNVSAGEPIYEVLNFPKSVWDIYWAALQWDYNDANLCKNYVPPKPVVYQ